MCFLVESYKRQQFGIYIICFTDYVCYIYYYLCVIQYQLHRGIQVLGVLISGNPAIIELSFKNYHIFYR